MNLSIKPPAPALPNRLNVDAILARMAERHSCREFDGTAISREEMGTIIAS